MRDSAVRAADFSTEIPPVNCPWSLDSSFFANPMLTIKRAALEAIEKRFHADLHKRMEVIFFPPAIAAGGVIFAELSTVFPTLP